MAKSANLGFPRLGLKRKWKKASESYWAGKISQDELIATANELTSRHWQMQMDAEIDYIPCNDFAFYDIMLDMSVLLGAVPTRYNIGAEEEIDIDTHFAMARGRQDETTDVTAMEMTKWFDTNYHYIVPEFETGMKFRLASTHPFSAVERAKKVGVKNPRPVIIGPVTYLLLGKIVDEGCSRMDLIDNLLDVYVDILRRFYDQGVEWVQMDEPALVLDLDDEAKSLYRHAYARFAPREKRPKMLITTYFGSVAHNADLATQLGEGLHIDLVRAPEQLDTIVNTIDNQLILSLGVVDGRNIWRTDLDKSFSLLERAARGMGGATRIQIAPSCSLLHCPIDLDAETTLDPEIKEWFAFGKQKLSEISALNKALNGEMDKAEPMFRDSREAFRKRSSSPRVTNPDVQKRLKEITDAMTRRETVFAERKKVQDNKLHLPLLPSTTIGSFPQTREVRKLRANVKKGAISREEYEKAMEAEIEKTVRFQEEIDLDVLVHGEFERNDMVEYFGEQLDGYVFSKNGWVQSYGSRGVKPPIIFGDIVRKSPMTVRWSKYAKDLTDHPMKGMLTGPVTMLQWSFVRDDQPRNVTCDQLALVIRDEVVDLEAAGIDVIQIDEPAIREGLPLRRGDWDSYLEWAVRSFRISASGVQDETQIHTHMCYSEFNDIFQAIADMDADVISIEASRSRMELLDAFEDFLYPNDIGPGVYDIHSPRVPSVEEMIELLQAALKHVPKDRLWVNPDCGLKTRQWIEVEPALKNMVIAAKEVRKGL